MNAFLFTAGAVFALIVIAHVARMFVEPHVAGEPWFWVTTVIAAALSAWAWLLFVRGRRPKGSDAAR